MTSTSVLVKLCPPLCEGFCALAHASRRLVSSTVALHCGTSPSESASSAVGSPVAGMCGNCIAAMCINRRILLKSSCGVCRGDSSCSTVLEVEHRAPLSGENTSRGDAKSFGSTPALKHRRGRTPVQRPSLTRSYGGGTGSRS
eukprot:CAMPEP_0117576462 /NCGR_PEP_ID=MMETSP0784-20121206/62811_1 /TAXON_ID=39447 /ORGANISM="" /LENGTH=142 /DNA_ID=CAMNT_0005375717 /DNA_START=148 /DNA_END=576 /DNA_ORIENTATION=-